MKNILVIGGSGFLGSAIIGELARRARYTDACVSVPTRRPERARHLMVIPAVRLIAADVHDPLVLAGLMRGQDAVISLVGILGSAEGEPYGKDFARAHVELPRKLQPQPRKLAFAGSSMFLPCRQLQMPHPDICARRLRARPYSGLPNLI